MKFLPDWLRSRRGAGSPADPADHVRRALDAAGLDGRHGHAPGVQGVIEDALRRAGLAPGGPVQPASGPASGPARPPAQAVGAMLRHRFSGSAGSRDYRLHLPRGHASTDALPLVVMLHGCTQTPEDFAAGTRMNALADRHGFIVAWPEQPASQNQARCWNWFRPEDQQAGGGEPAILAGIIGAIADAHRVDRGRVFVAGLSAGAAMAVVMAHAHPRLVRAIGVHSGLPFAAAHDVPSAFAAMQGRGTAARAPSAASTVPMILFHGDADRTVAPLNARRLLDDAGAAALRRASTRGSVAGRDYTREVFTDPMGLARIEHWTLHGGGHAWSGGDPAGTYTDASGPDASAEMVRFFLALDATPRATG